jgi:hypothetical protein
VCKGAQQGSFNLLLLVMGMMDMELLLVLALHVC